MLNFERGNILSNNAQAIVIPVNTKGVAGKGLALLWAEADPTAVKMYQFLCTHNKLAIGKVGVVRRPERNWILFPTKEDWHQPSQLAWITAGLLDLRPKIKTWELTSIAIPALGCGLGSLRWEQVRPVMQTILQPLVDVKIHIYPPQPY